MDPEEQLVSEDLQVHRDRLVGPDPADPPGNEVRPAAAEPRADPGTAGSPDRLDAREGPEDLVFQGLPEPMGCLDREDQP